MITVDERGLHFEISEDYREAEVCGIRFNFTGQELCLAWLRMMVRECGDGQS